MEPITPNAWNINGLLPTEGVVILAGGPKGGKFTCAAQLAVCLATGENFTGAFPVAQPTRVAIVSNDEWRWRRLISRNFATFDASRTSRRQVSVVQFGHDLCWDDEKWAALFGYVEASGVKVVIVPFETVAFNLDWIEGDDEMVSVMGRFVRLAHENHCLVLILHSVQKYDTVDVGRSIPELIRGAGAICGVSDANLVLQRGHNNCYRLVGELRNAANVDVALNFDADLGVFTA
jgi:RecA-family ATPase